MHEENKYNISLNHQQLRVIERALDLYSRVGIGQFEIVAEAIFCLLTDRMKDKNNWEITQKFLDSMKVCLGFPVNGSLGITCEEVSDDAKIAYDMEKVIQKKIATVEDHEQYSVWHRGSMHLGSQQDIEIKDI